VEDKGLHILFLLCGDNNKASSRVRGFWIAEALEVQGCCCTLRWGSGKLDMLLLALQLIRYDAVVFQKVYSRYHRWLMILAKAMGKLCYLDIDDAPSKTNAPHTIRNFEAMVAMAHGVFAGSQHLHDYCKQHQTNTWLTPSSIYLKYYRMKQTQSADDRICLGWIGNGAHYKKDLIEMLVAPLTDLSAKYPVRFKVVGACGMQELYDVFGSIDGLEIDFIDGIEWSDPGMIAASISDFDIGLYPLLPNDFNHFKCGFKALEYMAMGIPVVSSAVAVNVDIVSTGENGFLVNTQQEWFSALDKLSQDASLRSRMGQLGRKKVEEHYNVDKTASLIRLIMINDIDGGEENE